MAIFASGSGLAATLGTGLPPGQLEVVTGTPKPALALVDLDGSRHDLEQLAGKVVLVHFFATWCEPCREELTSLSGLVARSDAGKLAVLAVNVAEVSTRLQRFFETTPVNFPVLLDSDRAVTKAWGVSALPTTFVLDRKGAARLHVEGDIDWLRPDVLNQLEEVGAIDPN